MSYCRTRQQQAVLRRPLEPKQYTSAACIEVCERLGLRRSMGRTGSCLDNAVAESFFATLKVELLDRQRWHTHVELASAIFEYLEIFHNRQRRHSSLGMLTPIEFENTFTVA